MERMTFGQDVSFTIEHEEDGDGHRLHATLVIGGLVVSRKLSPTYADLDLAASTLGFVNHIVGVVNQLGPADSHTAEATPAGVIEEGEP